MPPAFGARRPFPPPLIAYARARDSTHPRQSTNRRLSAFHYFDLRALINTGAYPVGDSLLFLGVAIVGWVLALWVFRRRDLAA